MHYQHDDLKDSEFVKLMQQVKKIEKPKVKVVGWGEIQACDNCGTRYCEICKDTGHTHGVIVWLDGDSIAQRELCNKCLREHYEETK